MLSKSSESPSQKIDPNYIQLFLSQNKTISERQALSSSLQLSLSTTTSIQTFTSSFESLISTLPISFFYFNLISDLFLQLHPSDLLSLSQTYNLVSLSLSNLQTYLISLQKQNFQTLSTHEEEIKSRLVLLELINSRSLYHFDQEEILMIKIILFENPDLISGQLFRKSFFTGLKFSGLCNNFHCTLVKIRESGILKSFELSFEFFKFFKELFMKVNEGVYLDVRNRKDFCVLKEGIQGLDELVLIFFRGNREIMKKSRNILIVLITCFSTKCGLRNEKICEEVVLKVKNGIREGNLEDLERVWKFIYFFIDSKRSIEHVRIELVNGEKACEMICSKSVNFHRFSDDIADHLGKNGSLVGITIGSKYYSNSDKHKILKFEDNSRINVYFLSNCFQIELEVILNYFHDLYEIFLECYLKENFFNHKLLRVLFILDQEIKIQENFQELISDTYNFNDHDFKFQIIFNYRIMKIFLNLDYLLKIFVLEKNFKPFLKSLINLLKTDLGIELLYTSIKFCYFLSTIQADSSVLINFFCELVLICYINFEKLVELKFLTKDQEVFHYYLKYTHKYLINKVQISKNHSLINDFVTKYFESIKKALNINLINIELAIFLFECTCQILNLSNFGILMAHEQLNDIKYKPLNKPNKPLLVISHVFNDVNKESYNKAKEIVNGLIDYINFLEDQNIEEENEDLNLVLNLLIKHKNLIDPHKHSKRLIKSLILPSLSKVDSCKCKNYKNRELAYDLIVSLAKLDPKPKWIKSKLEKLIRCKVWRKCDEKSFEISLNSSPTFARFVGLRNPACICYSNFF